MAKETRAERTRRAKALAIQANERGLWDMRTARAFVEAAARGEADLDFWEKALAESAPADAPRAELLDRIVEEAKATDHPMTGVDVTEHRLTNEEKRELVRRGCHLATGRQRGTLVVTYPKEARAADLRRRVLARRRNRNTTG